MSDTSLETSITSALSPTGILGLTLVFISATLFGNWSRLDKWIIEVKELVDKQEMAATRRLPNMRQQQSVSNVSSGGDTSINQQITNHYNHRPDSLKVPIIATVIGAIGIIAAVLVHKP